MRALLLALALALPLQAAGDFTFDCSSNTDCDVVQVDTITPFRLPNAHSVAIRFSGSHNANTQQVITRAVGSGPDSSNWVMPIPPSTDGFRVNATSGGTYGVPYTVNSASVVGGSWYSGVFAFSSSSDARLYLDGALVDTDSTVAAADDSASAKVLIGGKYLTSTPSWDSSQDLVAKADFPLVFSRKLQAAEASILGLRNFRHTRVCLSGLVGRYPLRGAAGTNMATVRDTSASRADGTAYGTTKPTYTTGNPIRGIR